MVHAVSATGPDHQAAVPEEVPAAMKCAVAAMDRVDVVTSRMVADRAAADQVVADGVDAGRAEWI